MRMLMFACCLLPSFSTMDTPKLKGFFVEWFGRTLTVQSAPDYGYQKAIMFYKPNTKIPSAIFKDNSGKWHCQKHEAQ